jgi:NADPH-dependent ferric siderophore reductase
MTNDRPARRGSTLTRGKVRRVQWLTPHMIRVVIGGDGLAGFGAGAFTDHYVKLLFPVPGVVYPEPLDIDAVRRDMPRDHWPRMRSYTVRAWDPHALELTIDFVYHGDEGLAGPWAANAQVDDEISFLGPGGAYAPRPEADWHLLVGDESALPAIAASLEALPEGAPARVFVEVAGPGEEQDLITRGDAKLMWLHRGEGLVGEALVAAVRDLEFPPGDVHAFVHGEAGFVKVLRRYLRAERGIPLDRLSISGYWRYGDDDEGWRAGKAEWNRRIEVEEAAYDRP